MVVVLAVVAVLLGAAEARIAGSLGEGWHYLAPGLQLADLLPPPTRSPRQIIGSRSVCGHIVNNQGNVKICLLKRGPDHHYTTHLLWCELGINHSPRRNSVKMCP